MVLLDILFGSGIDSVGCLLDAAQDLGVIERRGSWYAFKGKNLAQGREKTIEYLKNTSVGSEIQEEVRTALFNFGKEDQEEDRQDEVDSLSIDDKEEGEGDDLVTSTTTEDESVLE